MQITPLNNGPFISYADYFSLDNLLLLDKKEQVVIAQIQKQKQS